MQVSTHLEYDRVSHPRDNVALFVEEAIHLLKVTVEQLDICTPMHIALHILTVEEAIGVSGDDYEAD